MNAHATQAAQQAGQTKLTAVTISTGHRRRQFFIPLRHNDRGEAFLPMVALDRMLTEMNIPAAGHYTITTG